jgi:hypothetical protein
MPGSPILSRPEAPRPELEVHPDAPVEEPVFREPWEAQAFSMAVALHERGLFTW